MRPLRMLSLLGLGLFLALMFGASVQAQVAPGVTLNCAQNSVNLDVSPGSSGEVSVICQVENDAAYEETVELSITGEDNDVNGILSDTLLVIAGSGMEEVTATFSADTRTEYKEVSFTINATVTKLGMVPLNEAIQPSSNANMEVRIQQFFSLDYNAMGFKVNTAPGESFNISAKIRNTGNSIIDLEVRISNEAEMMGAGVTCTPEPFIADMQINAYIDQVVVQCIVSEDVDESATIFVKLHARASHAGDEYLSEDDSVEVLIEVENEGGLGGLGSLTKDLSAEDQQMIMYVGGGLIGALVLLIIIVKLARRGGGGTYEAWDDEEFDFEL